MTTLGLDARVCTLRCLLDTRQYEAAIAQAEQTLPRLVGSRQVLNELDLLMAYGDALVATDRSEQAIAIFERCLEIATPELVEATLHMRSGGDAVIAGLRSIVFANSRPRRGCVLLDSSAQSLAVTP